MFWKQLFATKSLEILQAEVKGENRLRRVLGPIALTASGVGAIIGSGIFVMTGRVAAQDAGPAILLSFVVAGLGCLFAALCYAEFASTTPVAGSAYTYAYATLGELLAWIIGWDLILEYAVTAGGVAHGASKYFQDLISIFKLRLPDNLTDAPFDYRPEFGKFVGTGKVMDLPAMIIVACVTVVLVIGIRESARFNAAMVILKV